MAATTRPTAHTANTADNLRKVGIDREGQESDLHKAPPTPPLDEVGWQLHRVPGQWQGSGRPTFWLPAARTEWCNTTATPLNRNQPEEHDHRTQIGSREGPKLGPKVAPAGPVKGSGETIAGWAKPSKRPLPAVTETAPPTQPGGRKMLNQERTTVRSQSSPEAGRRARQAMGTRPRSKERNLHPGRDPPAAPPGAGQGPVEHTAATAAKLFRPTTPPVEGRVKKQSTDSRSESTLAKTYPNGMSLEPGRRADATLSQKVGRKKDELNK